MVSCGIAEDLSRVEAELCLQPPAPQEMPGAGQWAVLLSLQVHLTAGGT